MVETDNNGLRYAGSFKEQFTIRGIIIGCIGTIVLTTSSLYVALKLGALPWPIIFVALASMFSLKLLGNTNVNEINVTHTAMSAGAMVAGGLAFTIPGIWILDPTAQVSTVQLLCVSLGGTILGLIFTALIRKYFIVNQALPYPMGQAAAETLIIGDEGSKKTAALFISMGFAGIFTAVRDWFGGRWIPSTIVLNKNLVAQGISFQLWLSPMLIAVGYIIGPLYIGIWFLGALLGDFGIVLGGTYFGLWDSMTASAIKSSLGIGVMVGTGIGIIVKGILPSAKEILGPLFQKGNLEGTIVSLRWAPAIMLILVFVFTYVADIGLLGSVIAIVGVWLTTSMSAQVVGQSGINPMEVFGVIVMLTAKIAGNLHHTAAFFIAAIVAIACGISGDIMNDFKAGHILKSDPKAQWLAEVVGGMIGAVVAVGVLLIIINAYGVGAFGDPEGFVAPQAGAVAAMVGGIPHPVSFFIGLIAGVVLYVLNLPVMTLGLGIYLPFYLSLTAFIGGVLKFAAKKVFPKFEEGGTGMVIASGLLGGEAVVGVVIALIQVCQGLL